MLQRVSASVTYFHDKLLDSALGFLLQFPCHCQCPETDLTLGLGTPKRNNRGSGPLILGRVCGLWS